MILATTDTLTLYVASYGDNVKIQAPGGVLCMVLAQHELLQGFVAKPWVKIAGTGNWYIVTDNVRLTQVASVLGMQEWDEQTLGRRILMLMALAGLDPLAQGERG